MPRAPSIIPNIPQQPIGARGYSAPEVTPQRNFTGQMLAQQGQALQRAGESIGAYANEVRLQTVQATAQEKSTFLHEQFRKSESEFGAKLGPDAVRAFADYEKSARKLIDDEVAKLSDPDAKRLVRLEGLRRMQRSLDWATDHRDQQLASWRTSSTEAAVNEEAMSAYEAKLRGDEKGYEEAKGRSVAKAQELARLKGFDEVQTRRVVEAANNFTHAGVIDGYVERGKGFEAFGYLEKHKDEMSPSLYEDRRTKARAAMIEEGARLIDSTVGSYDERLSRVREMVADGQLTPEDGESASRFLSQFEEQRQTQRAVQGQEVRREAEAFLAQNPQLTVAELPPNIAERVQEFGVQVRRTVSNPAFREAMRTDEGMRRLRFMSPERRAFELQNNLTPRDAEDAEKLIVGDQNGYTISQLTKQLAIQSGVIPAQSERGQAGFDEQKLLDWERNTIAPLVDSARTKLGRPLTVRDFEELIRPLQEDKVWKKASTFGVDSFSSDTEMTVLAAQAMEDGLPVDDPATRNVDESLDVRNNAFYVKVGTEEVRLSSIPMQERRKIREAYRNAWIKTHGSADNMPTMTAAEEARRWVEEGRAGDRAKKVVGSDRIPGVGWGVGDLNRADLPDLPDRSGEPDEYIIPGLNIQPPK